MRGEGGGAPREGSRSRVFASWPHGMFHYYLHNGDGRAAHQDVCSFPTPYPLSLAELASQLLVASQHALAQRV